MSTTNQVPLDNTYSPSQPSNPSNSSSDDSAEFSPTPPHSPSQRRPSTFNFRSLPTPRVEPSPQLDVPLLHSDTGLASTLDFPPNPSQPLPPSPPPPPSPRSNQHESESSFEITFTVQSPRNENHLQSSPNVSPQPLPELPLHLIPHVEEELDLEQLEECLQMLQSANNRLTPEDPHHMETENEIIVDTEIDDASVPEQVPLLNGTPTSEVQQDVGGFIEEEIIDGGSGDVSPLVSWDTLGILNSPFESLQEVQEEEFPERQNDMAQSPRGLDNETHSNNIMPTHGQPNESPVDNIEVEPQRRRRGRKRRRREVETGYWLRSKKPPSSSKRSRRTTYWLRP